MKYYCPFQKRRRVGIFWITFDRNKIETCGFHHSKEQCPGYNYMSNSIGQAIEQSGEFLLGMFWTIFWKHFPFGFDFRYSHSIEKIFLFRSRQGRARWHVPFRLYKHFPESSEIGQMTYNDCKLGQDKGNLPRWVEQWCLFLVSKWSYVTKSRFSKYRLSTHNNGKMLKFQKSWFCDIRSLWN